MKPKSLIYDLQPYKPSKRFAIGSQFTLMDWNENDIGPTPNVHNIRYIGVERYPDINCDRLRNFLSQYVGMDTSFIEVYPGSDAALHDIFCVFVDGDTKVVSFQPTYSQIDVSIGMNTSKYFKLPIENPLGEQDGEVHRYPFGHYDFCVSDVVYLCNPNNPTGSLLPKDSIEELLNKYPEKLFIVDEAYIEFVGTEKSVVYLTETHRNLLVTRTFSKAFGLAGVRLGYVIGHPDTLYFLRKVKNNKSISGYAQLCGIEALKDMNHLQYVVNTTKNNKKRLCAALNAQPGWRAYPFSSTNFMLIKVPDVMEFKHLMYENRILLRDRTDIDRLERCFRITIGSDESTNKFLKAIGAKVQENVV